MQNKGSELPKEHILVCLSSSPSNERIEELGQWHQATFFYESALNTLLLIVMLISYPHFRKKGYLLPFYMIGYGVIRCFVEGLRTDSLYLMPGVRVS